MNNSSLNLITPSKYLEKIQEYQFDSIIKVNKKRYSEAIHKELLKEFYGNLIDKGVELLEEAHYRDLIINKSSENAYIVLDREDIKSYCGTYELYTFFILDLIDYFDVEDNEKYQLIYSLLREEVESSSNESDGVIKIEFIVKLKKTARNLKYFPVYKINLENDIMFLDCYDYKNLSFNF
tara:strand:+ start:3339 stop:3878 length:540 start_codon:yes stop_codon:yes gene_type:complete